MDTTLLLGDAKVSPDPALAKQLKSTLRLALAAALKWLSFEALAHATLAALATGSTYILVQTMLPFEPVVSIVPHALTGLLLGALLVARVVLGSYQAAAAAQLVVAFANRLRSLAVLAAYVSETFTVAAGAELEKRATANFRYELVRLLNLAFYCYALMLKGLKLMAPPASLLPPKGGKESEAEGAVLAVVSCPTAMVCKWVTNLLEKQRAASRLTDGQLAVFTTELIKLMEVYAATNGLQIAPMPAALNGFTYAFLIAWLYSVTPVVAVFELHDNGHGSFNALGFGMSVGFSFFIGLFFFGLFEAGKLVEAPLKQAVKLIPLDDLGHTLSDDLSNLVEDPDDDIPVFLTRDDDGDD